MRHNPAAYTVINHGNNSVAHNPATLGGIAKSSLVNGSTANLLAQLDNNMDSQNVSSAFSMAESEANRFIEWPWTAFKDTKKGKKLQLLVDGINCDHLIPLDNHNRKHWDKEKGKKVALLGVGAVGFAVGASALGGAGGDTAQFLHHHTGVVAGVLGADAMASIEEGRDSVIELEVHGKGQGNFTTGAKIVLGMANFVVFGIAIAGEIACHGLCVGQIVHTAHWIMVPLNGAMLAHDAKTILDENAEHAAFTELVTSKCRDTKEIGPYTDEDQPYVWPGGSGYQTWDTGGSGWNDNEPSYIWAGATNEEPKDGEAVFWGGDNLREPVTPDDLVIMLDEGCNECGGERHVIEEFQDASWHNLVGWVGEGD